MVAESVTFLQGSCYSNTHMPASRDDGARSATAGNDDLDNKDAHDIRKVGSALLKHIHRVAVTGLPVLRETATCADGMRR